MIRKNKKGFTLIELLVAISIMGIIMIIALPQMSKLKERNNQTKYKKYAETLLTSAKLYVDSYTEDMFGNNPSGCVDINYQELKNKDLAKEIKVDGAQCAYDTNITFVRVRKINDYYMYEYSISCKKDKKIVYEKTLHGPCDNKPDFTGPEIRLTQSTSEWTTGEGENATLIISDQYGMAANAKVKLQWTDEKGEQVGKVIEHDFGNNQYDGTESNPLKETFDVLKGKTGEYTLTVIPVDVRDGLGNRTTESKSVTFKLDNTPPEKPIVKAYKWMNNTTEPTSSSISKLKSYKNDDWTNKYVYTQPSECSDNNAKGVYYNYKTTGVIGTKSNQKQSKLNINKEGISTIQYQACDKLNNCSEYSEPVTIKIDTTSPRDIKSTTRTSSNSGTVRTNSDKWTKDTLWWGEWSAKDDVTGIDTSGIDRYEYSTNCTGTKSGNLSTSYTYDTTGERKYCIRAVDGAGNEGSWSKAYYFNVDKTPPTCGSHNGSTTWTNSSRTITLNCSDNVKCKQTTYKEEYKDSGISKSTDTIIIEDHVGNTSQCSINVYVDKKIPTLADDGSIGAVSGSNKTAYIKKEPSASDQSCAGSPKSCSDIKEIRYIIKTSNSTPSKSEFKSTSKSYQRACGQTNYAWAVAIDKAGNMSSVKSLGSSSDKTSSYGGWSSCSKKCGTGTQTRTNTCALVTTGLSQTCNTQACCSKTTTTNGSWGSCSKKCGIGTQTRTVTYKSAYDGSVCSTKTESQNCNTQSCCSRTTTTTGSWGSCSKSCGTGTQSRTITYKSAYDGSVCSTKTESQNCNTQSCCSSTTTTNGSWSSCSKGCGGGTQSRTITYKSAYNGSVCSTKTESRNCNTESCCSSSNKMKIGTGAWSSCSASCGGGTQTRTIYYESSITGQSCPSVVETRSCNTSACAHTHRYGNYYKHMSATYTNYRCLTRTGTHSWSDCSCKKKHTQYKGDKYCRVRCIDCAHEPGTTWCPDDY